MRLGFAIALILWPLSGFADPQAQVLGTYRWDIPGVGWFGGVSGFDLTPDGRRFVAVTDRGTVFQGWVHRAGGRISGISLVSAQKLNGANELAGHVIDAEGVAVRPDGSFCVSFEGTHLTGCYANTNSMPSVLPAHPDFDTLPGNASLESLAVDSRNRLIAIPEGVPAGASGYPVYRWQAGAWRRVFTVERHKTFQPVGADFGPDGRLYLLERAFLRLGFRSRIRSWYLSNGQAKDEKVHWLTPVLQHGNLEAVSVWQDNAGRIRATLVAGDNFLSLQRSEIVELALSPLASARPSR